MDVITTKPDGTVTYISGTPEEIKGFFEVTNLPNSLDEPVEGLAPGVYAVTDGWTPDYLTTGKYYKVFNAIANHGGDIIKDSGNSTTYIVFEGSLHLNGGNWRKVVVE